MEGQDDLLIFRGCIRSLLGFCLVTRDSDHVFGLFLPNVPVSVDWRELPEMAGGPAKHFSIFRAPPSSNIFSFRISMKKSVLFANRYVKRQFRWQAKFILQVSEAPRSSQSSAERTGQECFCSPVSVCTLRHQLANFSSIQLSNVSSSIPPERPRRLEVTSAAAQWRPEH